jgi:hypothetical protein
MGKDIGFTFVTLDIRIQVPSLLVEISTNDNLTPMRKLLTKSIHMHIFGHTICNPSQIIECKMRKQDHSELFIIEAFVVLKGAPKISYPLWDVGFFIGDNSIHGS